MRTRTCWDPWRASVVDCTNPRHFAQATRNLLAAEQRARVRHHVLLSVVSVDRVPNNAHYAGKREQEALLAASAIPTTIQRATQFYEYAEMLVGWTRTGNVVYLPQVLLQPVAARDVADVLVELATGAPQGRAADLAGPERLPLIEMAQRIFELRAESLQLLPAPNSTSFAADLAEDAFLPGRGARIAPMTFDTWLEEQRQARTELSSSASLEREGPTGTPLREQSAARARSSLTRAR